MSGNCFPGSTTKKITCWADAWDETTLQFADSDDLNDDASQVSDSTVEESHIYDVKQSMRKLFEDQMYTDVRFNFKNNRKATISAHRAILAVGSPLFAQMILGRENEPSLVIEINNLPFETFTAIVKYLYTGEIFLESDANVQAILEGAKQFQISPLLRQCQLYFQSQELTERNVCSKLQTSLSSKIEILKNRCIEYIQENIHQVMNSDDFLKCNTNTIRTICRLQYLNLKREVDLLHAVMRWWNNQNVPDETMLTESLLRCFRFLTFTVNEFGVVLKRYPNLMSGNDGLQIVLYLSNPPKTPDFKSLPSWLNKSCTKRCVATQNPCSLRSENIPPLDVTSVGKIFFPLERTSGVQIVTELTSLLQMKCISGIHEIKSIKLSFQPPISVKSVIRNIDIKVHVHPCNLNVYEHIEVANSLEVTVTFSRAVKVRRGDLIDIEVEARNMQFYRFLQFDETCCMPENRHFKCFVSSRPQCGRLYFIKEVEYGPQQNPNVGPSRRNRRRPNMQSMQSMC